MIKITPNRLTLLRIFLLPLPCLLLFGGPESKLTAVGLGSLLGFTDYLDGRLARRQGSTRLGALLDPIADKIFVSVTYLLLYRLTYLPFWSVFLILAREILVSALRNLFPERARVWSLARIKTACQMSGAGIIILAENFAPWVWRDPLLQGTTFLVLFLTWLSALPYLKNLKYVLHSSAAWGRLGFYLFFPLGLLSIFPLSGTYWPLVLVALALSFLGETLWGYRRAPF